MFPDSRTLEQAIASVLSSNGSRGGRVTILNRKPNIYSSRYPTEIVSCRMNGRTSRLLIKYGLAAHAEEHGHPIGTDYEGMVYRQVLKPIEPSTAKFYGAYLDSPTGISWLVLEYVDTGTPAHHRSVRSLAMGQAARWIGQFHAVNVARLADTHLTFLSRYDAAYYRRWSERTLDFTDHGSEHFSWLSQLCGRYEQLVDLFLAQPVTVVHGDYYADNVVYRRGAVFPLDWECASIAAGEIDLATLSNGWDQEMVEECEREYCRARWPDGTPADFKQRLDTARVFVLLRLLGEAPGWPDEETRQWHFELLKTAGERSGLI